MAIRVENVAGTDLRTEDGTVQLVIPVHVLEVFLNTFPRMETFPVPVEEDEIPTYGLRAK